MDKPKTVLAAIERLEAEKRRRIDEKIERGEAVREELVIVRGVSDDASDLEECFKGLTKTDDAGREVIFDPITVIYTGVPRPGRDKYVARLDREARTRESEIEAAARVAAFHEGSKSHEPEYKPPLLPKAPEGPAVDELEWRPVWVQVRAPNPELGDPGGIAEGRLAVWQGMVRVEDIEGRLVGTEALQPGDDPLPIARRLLREKRGGTF
jgi:hypothetical protein